MSHEEPGAADPSSVDQGRYCSIRFCPPIGLRLSHYLHIYLFIYYEAPDSSEKLPIAPAFAKKLG